MCSHHSGQVNAREGPTTSPIDPCSVSPFNVAAGHRTRSAPASRTARRQHPCPDARVTFQGMKDGVSSGSPGARPNAPAGNLLADVTATSDDWEPEKPSPEFFAAMVNASGSIPNEAVYVGVAQSNRDQYLAI